MKIRSVLLATTLVISGCGDDAGIIRDEAKKIASMSQDADQHLDVFTDAVQELGKKDECSASAMREYGGFMRVTGDSRYFLYCGTPNNRRNRWYLDPRTGHLSQTK